MTIRKSNFCRATGAAVAILIASGFAVVAAEGQSALPARSTSATVPQADACSVLAGRKVESGLVEGAETFSKGQAIVGGETAGATAGANLCRARLMLQPEPGSSIKVEVWLPETWNGKMFGFGGAGFDGGLSPGGAQSLNKVVAQGYAAVQTDVGHKPVPGLEAWVHKQPEKVVDFGHRGNHLAAVVAKQVIAAYYGNPAKRSYFLGCSNGGRDALMAASRYPEDYDGIVAGAPARRYLEVLTQLLWYHQAVHGPGGAPTLETKLGLVHYAIMKKCDRLDGVNDGIMENPQRCRFDPAELQCKGGDVSTCLTKAEVAAFRKIYGGPQLSSGQQISSGLALGSEGIPNSWTAWVTTLQTAAFGQEFYRWMVFDDPKWNVEDFKLDRDYPLGRERVAPIVNVDSADLTAFARRGGKLIIYQGWDDPIIAPTDTINYYEDIRKHVGSNADEHVRLFMVPGMGHCAGGSGASSFDMQPELEHWIEQGKAPERVIAIKPDSAEPFSRPLCAWPKTARYDGSGSSNDAANFNCKAPR
jgi:feruloyl esterase